MPFIQQIEFKYGLAGFWEMTETPDELLKIANLSDTAKQQFSKITSQKRQVEFLATRILTDKITGSKNVIFYQPGGKPTLHDKSNFISISHSANLVVVFISKLNCGVDAETLNRDTDRIASRFLHASEAENIRNSAQPKLLQLLHWCAKEAIFKCSLQEGVQFSEQIKILPFDLNTQTLFKGSLTSETYIEFFQLWFMTLKNNMVVFCVELNKKAK
jgi:phosphopantetheinyl transferase